MKLSDYLLNGTNKGEFGLALRKHLGLPRPTPYKPVEVFQLFGGKRWALAIVRLGEARIDL